MLRKANLFGRTTIFFLFLVLLCVSGSNASENEIVKIVGENGMEISLNSTTVATSRIDVDEGAENTNDAPIYSIYFTFTDIAAEKFSKLTAANVGKVIRIFLNDQIIFAPVVRERISGNSAAMPAASKTEAETILTAIRQ